MTEIPRSELYGASPVDNLWSPRFELEIATLPRGWDGARVAVISDFQLGLWEGNEAVATAATRLAVEQGPDLVVLLGDFVAVGEDYSALRRVLAPLQGRRVVAVLGDRDTRSDSIEARLSQQLTEAGVQVLRNTTLAFDRGGESLHVAGLDPRLTERAVEQQRLIVAELGAGGVHLLMTHVPTMAALAPNGLFPVTLGGNTLCGEVEVEGTPRLSWLKSQGFPGAAIEGLDGLFLVQGGTLLVTCGIGYGFLPLRFSAAPEVPVITLRSGLTPAAADSVEVLPDSLFERFQNPPSAPTDSAAVVTP